MHFYYHWNYYETSNHVCPTGGGGHGKNFRHRGRGWVGLFFAKIFFFHFLETFFLTMNIGLSLFILVVRLQKSCNIHVYSSGCCPKNTIILQNEQKLHAILFWYIFQITKLNYSKNPQNRNHFMRNPRLIFLRNGALI